MRRHNGIRRALALCIGVCVMLSLCPAAGAADLGAPCSVRVAVSEELREDLLSAGLVFDLYQIAAAVPAGEGGFTYGLLAPYEAPEEGTVMDSAAWTAFAQSAAAAALGEGVPVVTGAGVGQTVTETDDGQPLGPGLYLLTARGASPGDRAAAAEMDDGEERLVTVAFSDEYAYYFLPEMFSLPARGTQQEAEAWPLIMEDRDTAWSYDRAITLKPTRAPRFGSVSIDKALLTYELSEPATFVFEIVAELDGAVVYADVAAMTFTAAGEQHVLAERIPVGAEVTVREVYSGSHYRAVTDTEGHAVVSADEIAHIPMENEYSGTPTGGHGIINRFTYDGETWQWVQSGGGNAGGEP